MYAACLLSPCGWWTPLSDCPTGLGRGIGPPSCRLHSLKGSHIRENGILGGQWACSNHLSTIAGGCPHGLVCPLNAVPLLCLVFFVADSVSERWLASHLVEICLFFSFSYSSPWVPMAGVVCLCLPLTSGMMYTKLAPVWNACAKSLQHVAASQGSLFWQKSWPRIEDLVLSCL